MNHLPLVKRVVAYYKIFIRLAVFSWCQSFFAQARPLQLQSSLKSTLAGKHILQCGFRGGREYFSTVSSSDIQSKSGVRSTQVEVHLFNSAGKVLKTLVVDKKQQDFFSSNLAPEKKFYEVSHDLTRMALCRSTGEKSKLEIWDLNANKIDNIFKLSTLNCGGQFYFNNENSKLAYLSTSQTLALWDLVQGIRIKIPDDIGQSRCQAVSKDFSTAYCIDSSLQLEARKIANGKLQWRAAYPKALRPNWVERWVLVPLQAFPVTVPNFLLSIRQFPPKHMEVIGETERLLVLFNHPFTKRPSKIKSYRTHLAVFNTTTGKVETSHVYEEPFDLDLGKIRIDYEKGLLVGPDQGAALADHQVFFSANLKNGQKKRSSLECAQSWDLVPGLGTVITCGYCNGRSMIGLWKSSGSFQSK